MTGTGTAPGVAAVTAYQLADALGYWPVGASGLAPGVTVPIEDRTLGELDPPSHTLVRRAMVTALTPKSVNFGHRGVASNKSGAATDPPLRMPLNRNDTESSNYSRFNAPNIGKRYLIQILQTLPGDNSPFTMSTNP